MCAPSNGKAAYHGSFAFKYNAHAPIHFLFAFSIEELRVNVIQAQPHEQPKRRLRAHPIQQLKGAQ